MFFGTKSHYTILANYVTSFEVDAEMSEICTDFQGKNPRKILPIDFNGSEIIDISVLAWN